MADYPTLTQLIGTSREVLSGIRMNRAVSGKPRFAKYSTQDWFVFRVLHYVDSTDLASLQAHYAAHRMLEFDFLYTATNETYKVQYSNSPRLQTMEGDDGWVVENVLVGTGRIPFAHINLKVASTLTVAKKTGRRSNAVALTLTSSVSAVGAHVRKVAAVVNVPEVITIGWKPGHKGSATMSSVATVEAVGNKSNVNKTATVTSVETVTVEKTTDRAADVTVSSTSSVTTEGTRPGTVAITVTETVTATGTNP